MEEVKKLLKKLKLECDRVTIFIKAGDKCCKRTGCICKVTDCFVVLFNEECKKTHIPFKCICAISKLKEEKTMEEDNKKIHYQDNEDEVNSENKEEDDYQEIEEDKDSEDNEKEETREEKNSMKEESVPKVYGYGRKIRLNFKEDDSDIIVDKINIAELSVDVSGNDESESNYIEYFYKDAVGERSISLSLLPSDEGEVTSLTCDGDDALVEGTAILYFDSKRQGVVEFELQLTNNKAQVRIENEEGIDIETEELVGVGTEKPFTIEEGE